MFDRIEQAASSIAAEGAEIVYIYSDFRGFGQILEGDYKFSKKDFFTDLLNIFNKLEMTVVVPTFSYTTSGIFHVDSTPTNLGALSKFVLTDTHSVRSEHPLFSFSALGASAKFLSGIGKEAFGTDSAFSRMLDHNSYVLHIGRPVSAGNTIIHFIEQKFSAWYRFEKIFPTRVFIGDQFVGDSYSAYLRRQDQPGQTFETNFLRGSKLLFENGVMHESGLNKDYLNVSYGSMKKVYDSLCEAYLGDNNFFI